MKATKSVFFLVPGLFCMFFAVAGHASSYAKECIMDSDYFVNFDLSVGDKAFWTTVKPASGADASRNAMCSCAKAINRLQIQEYNERYPAAFLRGEDREGCRDYGDGGQSHKLYWTQ